MEEPTKVIYTTSGEMALENPIDELNDNISKLFNCNHDQKKSINQMKKTTETRLSKIDFKISKNHQEQEQKLAKIEEKMDKENEEFTQKQEILEEACKQLGHDILDFASRFSDDIEKQRKHHNQIEDMIDKNMTHIQSLQDLTFRFKLYFVICTVVFLGLFGALASLSKELNKFGDNPSSIHYFSNEPEIEVVNDSDSKIYYILVKDGNDQTVVYKYKLMKGE